MYTECTVVNHSPAEKRQKKTPPSFVAVGNFPISYRRKPELQAAAMTWSDLSKTDHLTPSASAGGGKSKTFKMGRGSVGICLRIDHIKLDEYIT
jgi:hypothetical protein